MRTLILLLAVAPIPSLWAQAPLPPVVQQGLDALKKGKCQDAFDLWTRTWPDVQKAQMAASCSALRQFGGEFPAMTSCERSMSRHTSVVSTSSSCTRSSLSM
jgi:hypothetical protein